MAARPGTRPRSPLERRVRANCCEFHGLTAAGFDRHVAGIVRMIEQARSGRRAKRGQKLSKPRSSAGKSTANPQP